MPRYNGAQSRGWRRQGTTPAPESTSCQQPPIAMLLAATAPATCSVLDDQSVVTATVLVHITDMATHLVEQRGVAATDLIDHSRGAVLLEEADLVEVTGLHDAQEVLVPRLLASG